MKKGLLTGAALLLALPAFAVPAANNVVHRTDGAVGRARVDTREAGRNVGAQTREAGRDLRDGAKDTSDNVQDALHTDSGTHKMARHARKGGRHLEKGARHTMHKK